MITVTTRYRVTCNGAEYWHDELPSEEWIEDRVYIAQARGYEFRIERVTTTEDDSIPWGRAGGGRLISKTQTTHEYIPE